jgi:menaquinone-dependent protoporphyrinogen oxidase
MEDEILVAYATAAGATGEIADVIGQVLREAGATVDVVRARDVTDLSPYSGVVVGSGIRAGRPYAEATKFMAAQQAALSEVPVACFIACATLREDTEENRREAAGYVDALAAAAPQVRPVAKGAFGGAIDYSKLNFLLRLILKAMKAEEGDFRDWDAIRTWAAEAYPKLVGS